MIFIDKLNSLGDKCDGFPIKFIGIADIIFDHQSQTFIQTITVEVNGLELKFDTLIDSFSYDLNYEDELVESLPTQQYVNTRYKAVKTYIRSPEYQRDIKLKELLND